MKTPIKLSEKDLLKNSDADNQENYSGRTKGRDNDHSEMDDKISSK